MMDEKFILAMGNAIRNILLGIASIITAYNVPQAISNYAVNVKTEQVMQSTLKNVSKIITSIKNENNNTIINQYKSELQDSLANPQEFKKDISKVPRNVLIGLGMKTSKEKLVQEINKANTKDEIEGILKVELPDILLDSEGKPFTLDESKLAD